MNYIIKSMPFNAVIVDEEQRLVEGFLGDDGVDFDGHMIDRAGYQKAIDEYMQWGNIREMHKDPVGIIVSHGEKSWNHIVAKIVDDKAWNLVKSKVYKGFSIGARVLAKSWKNIHEVPTEKFYGLPSIIKDAIIDMGKVLSIDAIFITEISVVDRPANPRALILAYKSLTADDDNTPLEVSTEILAAQELYFKGEIKMDETLNKDVASDAQLADENESAIVKDVAAQDDTIQPVPDEVVTTDQPANVVVADSATLDLTLRQSDEVITLSYDDIKNLLKVLERVDTLESKLTAVDEIQASITGLVTQFETLTKSLAELTIKPEHETQASEKEISVAVVESDKEVTDKSVVSEVKELNVEDIITKAVDAAVARYVKATEINDDRHGVVNGGDVEKGLDEITAEQPNFSTLGRRDKYSVLAHSIASTIR